MNYNKHQLATCLRVFGVLHMRRANLFGADLFEANLFGANLRGANLEGAM